MTIIAGLRRQADSCMRRLMRAVGMKGEEGSALLECAVTLPLFLGVIMGTASFSLAFYEMQELGNAVSAAGQELGATAGTIDDPCAQVVTQVTANLPNFNTANLTYTVVITNAAGSSATYGPTKGSLSCVAAGAGGAASTAEAANEPQTVTVSYQYPWMPVFTYGSLLTFKTPTSSLTASQTTIGE
jgi:Flp pilus assembly protein TadG